MTVKEAREVFARFMSVSRERTLTAGERAKLRTASQLIRHARRTTAASNKPKRKTIRRRKVRQNPGGRVLIYDRVTRIEAQKGKQSGYPGQKFFHNFKRPYPKMYGLPDGSLLIK